jgi:hypothetical protein
MELDAADDGHRLQREGGVRNDDHHGGASIARGVMVIAVPAFGVRQRAGG